MENVRTHGAGPSSTVSCIPDTDSEDDCVVTGANMVTGTEYNNQPSTSANSNVGVVGKKKNFSPCVDTSEEIEVKEENDTSEEIIVKEENDEHEEINYFDTGMEISRENDSIENIPEIKEEEEIEIVDEFQLFLDSQNVIKEDHHLMSNSANLKDISEYSTEFELKMETDRPAFNTATTLFVPKQEDLRMLTGFTTATAKPFTFKDVLTCVDTSMRWAGENHVDNGILTSLKDLRKEVTLRNYEDAHNVARMKD